MTRIEAAQAIYDEIVGGNSKVLSVYIPRDPLTVNVLLSNGNRSVFTGERTLEIINAEPHCKYCKSLLEDFGDRYACVDYPECGYVEMKE